jgi:hypothetical protein
MRGQKFAAWVMDSDHCPLDNWQGVDRPLPADNGGTVRRQRGEILCMTEQQENALRYETRKRGKELKAHIATLKAQMNRFDAAWQELGETFRNHLNVDTRSGLSAGKFMYCVQPRLNVPCTDNRPR